MFQQVTRKVFGSANDRTLKQIVPLVEAANRLEPQLMGSCPMPSWRRAPRTSASGSRTASPWTI